MLLKLKDDYARPLGLDLLFQGYPYAFTNLAGGPATVVNPLIFFDAGRSIWECGAKLIYFLTLTRKTRFPRVILC